MNYDLIVPFLFKCRNVASDYLKKHLTQDQIFECLEIIDTSDGTYSEIRNELKTKIENIFDDNIYLALEAFYRIRGMIDAAENPSKDTLSPERALHVVFGALRTGLTIGGIAGDRENHELLNYMLPYANRGRKFAESTGRKEDDLSKLLKTIMTEYYRKHRKLPSNKDVLAELGRQVGKGLIEEIDPEDNSIVWGGRPKPTSYRSFENRLTPIRKKLFTVFGKP